MTNVDASPAHDPDRTDPVLARKEAWHQSTLSTLLDGCSWQYFLTYELNLPTGAKPAAVVGIAHHSAIELHENARLAGDTDGVPLADMLKHAEAEVRAVIDDDELVTQVKASVTNWYRARTKDGGPSQRDWLMRYDPVLIEPYFRTNLVLGAKPVAGWIDGVYRHKETGELIIVDQKTASNFGRWGHDGAEHRDQAAMYAVALAVTDLVPEAEGRLLPMHYLIVRTRKGSGSSFEAARRVAVHPDMTDVAKLGDRVRFAEAIVAAESYAPRPEWPLCSEKWCPFYERCQGTGELAGTPQTIRIRLRGDE